LNESGAGIKWMRGFGRCHMLMMSMMPLMFLSFFFLYGVGNCWILRWRTFSLGLSFGGLLVHA
jgi:hypothetical protein